MMSELQPAAHGRKKPQTERLLKREKTWMAIRSAPFATPENALPAGAPCPATMPATCVPCSQPRSEQLAPAPGPTWFSWPLGHSVVLVAVVLE